MRTQTEKRSLPVKLTPEELAVESQRLAGAVEAAAAQEEKIADAKAEWSEKKKGMEGYLFHLKTECTALAVVVESGTAEREVECSWLYALKEGFAFLVRDDTGELATHRKLGDAERQTDLLEVVREPTPEQLASWIESLGLVVDPQQGLPLAEPGASIPYYRVIPTANGSKICGRFSEADHRPSSLTGVYVADEDEPLDKLAALSYSEDAEDLREIREQLEDLLAARQAEALATGREADPAGEPRDELSAPSRRKGARG